MEDYNQVFSWWLSDSDIKGIEKGFQTFWDLADRFGANVGLAAYLTNILSQEISMTKNDLIFYWLLARFYEPKLEAEIVWQEKALPYLIEQLNRK